MTETDLKEREIGSSDQAIRSIIDELHLEINGIPRPTVVFDAEQLPSHSTIEITEETLDSTSSAIDEVIVTEDSAVQIRELRIHKYVARATDDRQALAAFKRIS